MLMNRTEDSQKEVSAVDQDHLAEIRANVRAFMIRAGRFADGVVAARLLDIAPQIHEGARPFFPRQVKVETLDINPLSGATHIGDLCQVNPVLADCSFDFVVCTEVLEHVLEPFRAVAEMLRLLKPSGLAFVSTPFNFRIHGPLPDCWRFTEHGLRALFRNFEIVSLEALETKDRFLMPIHYTLIARRPLARSQAI